MNRPRRKWVSLLCLALLLIPANFVIISAFHSTFLPRKDANNQHYSVADGPLGALRPLRRAAFVSFDSASYIDDFAYMAAVPTSVFLQNSTQYISPLIYSTGSNSESWLIEDWAEYLGSSESITHAFSIGNFPENELKAIESQIGARVFPRLTGDSSAEIAAQLAVMDWESSDSVVVALAKDDFQEVIVTSGSASHTFDSPSIAPLTSSATVSFGEPEIVTFTPPSDAGWMYGSFDWSGSELLTHVLNDPDGVPVDYSVFNQVYFERNTAYVASPVPLHFWYPQTQHGTWSMVLDRLSQGPSTTVSYSIEYHPGFSQTVTIPDNAKWLNLTATWDNSGTDLNFALVDPDGRLVTWAPAESLLAGPLFDSMQVPYPMAGDWTIISAWMSPENEQNRLELSWEISSLPSDLQPHLESAANGAVLASLLNAPLLYAGDSSIPQVTSQAISRLGPDEIILVDPMNIHLTALEGELLSLTSTLTSLDSYTSVSAAISDISNSSDAILTTPTGTGDEFFAPAAFSGAFHGAPVFSLCGSDNLLTTRAEETWAPYFVSPQIDVYVRSRWTTRTENGWYDERIPNRYSMMESTDVFEQFLIDRGAYYNDTTQSLVLFSPTDLLKVSFDRSLQSHFSPGRIPAPDSALASVLANRGALHRFLYLTAESADEALLSLYAYTDGAPFVDNFNNAYEIWQIEDTQDALTTAGFSTSMHVGANEVFSAVDSQVGLWAFSTHGTLETGPRDPPERPYGTGVFSMRDIDTDFGFEYSPSDREYNGDRLVNPVLFEMEFNHHITRSTRDLEAAIGNIGSPIVILTACLLGGTQMPLMLMRHGAVGVTAAPRTVYFQPAGMLSILLVEALCEGNSTGTALSMGHSLISADYTDPLLNRDPRDYANQQVLFGDPSVKLYMSDVHPRIPAVDPLAIVFGDHTPGKGVPAVVGLSTDSSLPSTLSALAVDYEHYAPSNFSSFEFIFPLVPTVIVAPEQFQTFSPLLESSTQSINDYVRNGGTLVILGTNGDISWLPWPISIDSTDTGSSIAITDAGHPFMSSPNTLTETVAYEGSFSSVWSNLTILANGVTNPVTIAGIVGSGKLAMTTAVPTGSALNDLVENAVHWSNAPSLILNSIQTNQFIIWEGDRVVITIEITNQVGSRISGVSLDVLINETEVTVIEGSSGLYSITLDEVWTSGQIGTFDVRIEGRRAGYDSLSVLLSEFLTIRQFPLAAIVILGGVIAVVAVGSLYLRRRSGGFSRDRSDETKEQREQRRKEDERFDAREFFGV